MLRVTGTLTNDVIKFLLTHSHLICKFPFMEIIDRGMFLSGMEWCKSLRARSCDETLSRLKHENKYSYLTELSRPTFSRGS